MIPVARPVPIPAARPTSRPTALAAALLTALLAAACGSHAVLPAAALDLDLPPEFAALLPATHGVQPDTRAALTDFLRAAAADLPAAQRTAIDRWLADPAGFRLGAKPDDAADDAFLDLLQRFAGARAAAPIIAASQAWIARATWRDPAHDTGDLRFNAELDALRDDCFRRVAELNAATPARHDLQPFEWLGPQPAAGGAAAEHPARVLGVRLGSGPRKLSILTHLDTVPPGRDDWEPFDGRLLVDQLEGRDALLLRGRGAIDDKGPAATALALLDVLRAAFGDSDVFERVTLEAVFDTSEETASSTPSYLAATGAPWAGDVLDADWAVFAEKGGEATTFRVSHERLVPGAGAPPPPPRDPATLMKLMSVATPDGPTNQIPDEASAQILFSEQGRDEDLARLQAALRLYRSQCADAERVLSIQAPKPGASGTIRLQARGWGAAHASAPEVNRATGHNPLACLCQFLAVCHDDGLLAETDPLLLPRFLAWTVGHDVYGERHAALLTARDEIFTDGTTYALTRLSDDLLAGGASIDIRYALPHHAATWDRSSFGQLDGPSRFPAIWKQLVDEYNATLPSASPTVAFSTTTWAAPDIKDRNSPAWTSLLDAYARVMGRPALQRAIGGGTDAKGIPTLLACGPNFGTSPTAVYDAPINYHGREESAPIQHLVDSTRILTRWYSVLLFEP